MNSCFDAARGDGSYSLLDNEIKNELKTFDIFCENSDLRQWLLDALSFFIVGKCEFDEKNLQFITNASIQNDNYLCDGIINRENFDVVLDVIFQICHISHQIETPKKFKDDMTRQIWESAQLGRKERQKSSGADNAYEIPNIVSNLCTFHNSLNIINIWNLTVYQIYNQFDIQCKKNQIDIMAMNYSAWGGDKFDPSAWFMSNNKT